MQDLRIILVIIGALAIAALVIHGLWTNRKNKRVPIKEKPLGRVSDSRYATTAEPGDGFDADGIGKVRVVSRRNESSKPATKAPKQWNQQQKVEPELLMPQISATDDEPAVVEPAMVVETPVITPPAVKSWSDYYQVNIMARDGLQLDGQDLLFILKKLGFKFGEMDIFHRHLETDGQGEVLFSVANMVKPGTFDPARMSHFYTPGVSLFMELPPPGRAEAHLRLMMQAADKMSAELDALVMDRERKPLTEMVYNQYLNEVRAYDQQ
ncbi:cell division protein ZipA [Pseudaeromonas sharmana]|uniref:Cell division protein ZipA n=1 Tax=Pseudaeromonas sharmana TaxID=328412 RepID=A0ABV8CS06_9GAMM